MIIVWASSLHPVEQEERHGDEVVVVVLVGINGVFKFEVASSRGFLNLDFFSGGGVLAEISLEETDERSNGEVGRLWF